ncbi:hypothetical protein N431DRAFT_464366 [Stipitochalara longipes BDJ]|nr:hypothetical protein N431DRAFT_464366 [Stipitochalara longipes BDJ]
MELQTFTKEGVNIPSTQPSSSQAGPGPDVRRDSDHALSLPSQPSQLEDKKHYCWDSVPSYRLSTSVVEDFLTRLFGNFQFYVTFSNDNWQFWVPRPLTEGEREALLEQRELRRKRQRPSSPPPARSPTPLTVNVSQARLSQKGRGLTPEASSHDSPTPDSAITTLQPLSKPALPQSCQTCKIIIFSWIMVVAGSLAIDLWRSFATGDEGKGFTDAAYVVAAGSIIIFQFRECTINSAD